MLCACACVIKVVIGIFNGVLLTLSVLVMTAGAMLTVSGDVVLALLGKVQHQLSTMVDFSIPTLDQLHSLPLGPLGGAVIAIGVLTFLIALLGVLAAVCPRNCVMVVFLAVMALTTLIFIIMGSLLLCRASFIHDRIKDEVAQQLQDNYVANNTADAFSAAINVVQADYDCCGIRGPEDYEGQPLPASCCSSDIIDSDNATSRAQCIGGYAPRSHYSTKGCYDRLLEMLFKSPAILAVYVVFVLIQLADVALAIAYLLLDKLSIRPV